MSEKISEEAVLPISYHLFDKFVPRPEYSGKGLADLEDQAKYAAILADSFANFHEAFYNRLVERLSKDR